MTFMLCPPMFAENRVVKLSDEEIPFQKTKKIPQKKSWKVCAASGYCSYVLHLEILSSALLPVFTYQLQP